MLTTKITRNNLKNFLEKYATTKKVLDIGSGGSPYDNFFPNRLTLDVDEKRNPEVVADAHDLPFNDGEFEFVLFTEVLEHVKDPKKVISEIERVLKKGGILILTTRFVFPIHDYPNDYWRFTKAGLESLLDKFEILEIKEEAKDFSALAVLFQRMGYQNKFKFNKIIKLIMFVSAFILNKMNFLIKESYGDIKRETKVDSIMTSGYYIVAKKK